MILKVEQDTANKTEKLFLKIVKLHNRYIDDALSFYNKTQKRKLMAKKLQAESRLVQKESMSVLSEFESLLD